MAFENYFGRIVPPPEGVPETPFKVYLIQVRVYIRTKPSIGYPQDITFHGTIQATDVDQVKALSRAYEEVQAFAEDRYTDLKTLKTFLLSVQQLESSDVKCWNIVEYKNESTRIKEVIK